MAYLALDPSMSWDRFTLDIRFSMNGQTYRDYHFRGTQPSLLIASHSCCSGDVVCVQLFAVPELKFMNLSSLISFHYQATFTFSFTCTPGPVGQYQYGADGFLPV